MSDRDHLTCYYCKLHHEKVEAGGVYYCPNALCTGPGGASFRREVPSYAEQKDGTHTVDHSEMILFGRGYAAALRHIDRPLHDHVLASIPNWSQA